MISCRGMLRAIGRPSARLATWANACSVASVVVFASAVIAAADLATPTGERPCGDRADSLAREMVAKPVGEDLRNSLAQAAFLCSLGKAEEANAMLADIELRLRRGAGGRSG